MAQRKVAWASRGWEGYIHVDVAGADAIPTVAMNGLELEAGLGKRIPEKVWGEHAQ